MYKQHPGYSDKASTLFTIDLGAPEELPDAPTMPALNLPNAPGMAAIALPVREAMADRHVRPVRMGLVSVVLTEPTAETVRSLSQAQYPAAGHEVVVVGRDRDRMVVDENDPDRCIAHWSASRGIRTTTRTPPMRARWTSNVPPCSAARARILASPR
mgnify:CR=1 FL=1